MIKQIIYDKINKARAQRLLTNCYSLDVVEMACNIWEYGSNFIFSYKDHGINRLIYFAENAFAIDSLLDIISSGYYFLEFMTKDSEEYIPKRSSIIARMMRLANLDCRSVFDATSSVLQYFDESIGEYAEDTDIVEINNILWKTFHTEISHLLTDDELKTKINQLTIHRDIAHDGHIDAMLQADVMPKKFYINQIVNNGEPKIIHAMLLNRLKTYIEHGGRYIYAWVEDSNVASLKFHQKYGMKHDGMWSMIYSLER